jgi:hypothetical protein
VTGRLVVIDASLNKRLGTELRYRGFAARSLSQLGEHEGEPVAELLDPDLIPLLAERFHDLAWVLITADDNMPAEHAQVLRFHGATVATIDPYDDDKLSSLQAEAPIVGDEDEIGELPELEDMYQRDTVHRWAHRISRQANGSIRRYYRSAPSRPWTPRK